MRTGTKGRREMTLVESSACGFSTLPSRRAGLSPSDPPRREVIRSPLSPAATATSLLSRLILANAKAKRQLRCRSPRRLRRFHGLRAKPAVECGSGSYRLQGLSGAICSMLTSGLGCILHRGPKCPPVVGVRLDEGNPPNVLRSLPSTLWCSPRDRRRASD